VGRWQPWLEADGVDVAKPQITTMALAQRRALALSILTVGYNILEGVASVVAAALSGSTALFGFGLDSFVESLSGGVMIWRFWCYGIDAEDEEIERIERKASRLVSYSFFILGGYVTLDACTSLYRHEAPEPSILGLVIAISSVVAMPLLFLAKYRLGKHIGSPSLVADSKETLACVMLSVALLIGLGLNYLLRIWWVDSAAALVIGALIVREGWRTFEESRTR
jgi:cation diffusion facilitator family transporter